MSDYKLTNYEKETIIVFNEAETEAEVFTYNGRLIRQIEALCRDFPDKFKRVIDNGAGGITYCVPKRRVNITRPKAQENKTE